MRLEREAGVEIHRATLDGWVMRVGELLGPVVAAMREELPAGGYIQADETPVAVQMHDGRGATDAPGCGSSDPQPGWSAAVSGRL